MTYLKQMKFMVQGQFMNQFMLGMVLIALNKMVLAISLGLVLMGLCHTGKQTLLEQYL
ncbi:MAG: hypothetical protein KGD59_11655 [Candidatus Heimdallarchaeota archaeon]|nr:hypothetical protein [Candidatus Heimdallarchaeota archaeon]MBY8995199.1 hypothetical protein [Candidatus Heimdallarchaeota archaeon]